MWQSSMYGADCKEQIRQINLCSKSKDWLFRWLLIDLLYTYCVSTTMHLPKINTMLDMQVVSGAILGVIVACFVPSPSQLPVWGRDQNAAKFEQNWLKPFWQESVSLFRGSHVFESAQAEIWKLELLIGRGCLLYIKELMIIFVNSWIESHTCVRKHYLLVDLYVSQSKLQLVWFKWGQYSTADYIWCFYFERDWIAKLYNDNCNCSCDAWQEWPLTLFKFKIYSPMTTVTIFCCALH